MPETEVAEPNTIKIPIVKGKDVLEIDIDKLPDAVYKEVLLQGLKTIMNRGMSKVTVGNLGDEEKVKAEAMVQAQKNLAALYEGKVRITGGKGKSGVTGAVKTEALRLARNVIKDEIKKQGGKISHYKASEITEAAKAFLETDGGKSLIDMAKKAVEARSKKAAEVGSDLTGALAGLKEDPELVAKANAKTKKGGTLSAKQAGMTAKAKGKGAATPA